MKVVVATPRMIIREYAEQDLPLRLAIGADPVITRFTPKRTPHEIETIFSDNLRLYRDGKGLGRWAITEPATGEYIGDCMLMAARFGLSGIELGYMLHQKFWGMGLASEMAVALVDHAFAHLGADQIYAITNVANAASQKVLLKAGFVNTGTVDIAGAELLLFQISKGK